MATSMSYKSDSLSATTKLRHLKLKSWGKLVNILRENNRWLEVACRVLKSDGSGDYMYSAKDIDILQEQAKCGKCSAEAFLEHWSTSGKVQPSLQDLLNVLLEANLTRAADSISKEFFEESLFPVDDKENTDDFTSLVNSCRNNSDEDVNLCDNIINSTSCAFKNTLCIINEDANQSSINFSLTPEQAILENSMVPAFNYDFLAKITHNFMDIPVKNGGSKIGEGSFGTVYRALVNGKWMAIKRLKNIVDKQFLNELQMLTRYKHENLLPLLGYSADGPRSCLVYAYMINGSLQERLACVDDTAPLPWETRLAIAHGTAKGINHLHTHSSKPLVHRDIKSANVLLDEDFTPKLGDFGIARIGSTGCSSSAVFTANVYGTSVYMAREAFNGDVSAKLDTYSFGVVLLELLTGLPPYDSDREEKDLISYMEENCDSIFNVLDPKAGNWNENVAVTLYEIANRCLEIREKVRPTLAQVLPDIEKLINI